ncbi:MAG: hypothetical protein HY905_12795 [Deltaproteobacteria bacterium]|nr:hypothetical protein [Deltaproteobacteria bacterium]
MERRAIFLAAAATLAACGGADSGGPVPTETLRATSFTYTLEESTAALTLWTTPATRRLRTGDRPPEDRRSGLHLSAARNEFEPVQLVLGPASGTARVAVDPFPDLGADQRLELAVARYQDGWAEQLDPLASGGDVVLSSDHGVPVWLTVYVPEGAPAGEHATTLHVTAPGGGAIAVPVVLTVFDFALPREIHFDSLLYLDVSSLAPAGGTVEDAKDMLFEHRLTPTGVTWPSGFTWRITWDSDASPTRCTTFYGEPDEGDEYAIHWLARRYILGEGWNGVGFPSALAFQFVDNSTPRPDTFCGVGRGDQFGTAEYNAAWSRFLTGLEQYLVAGGMADKAYWYVQNEPQNEEDERLAAHLCRMARAAAPALRIAISEEPKPGIAEDSGGACGYDIWIAHIRAYEQGYAWLRQRDHGEEVWLYSLDHDPDPYFNPTRVDAQGMHERIIPWVSWHLRATGWAYYDAGRFFDGPNPTIRAELLREGFEDYEYLWLANGGRYPRPFTAETVDPAVDSAASGLTSWTKDPDALMTLRHELGRYIEGSRGTVPVLETDTGLRPRGAYHLNFQDPAGRPTDDPLVVGGNTYLKIGWMPYDAALGYGWYGEFVGDPSIALYGYDEVDGYDERQRSYVYDDYGRDNLFEFALANGRYEVTVGAGRPARAYPSDPHHVRIEGTAVIDDEPTGDAARTFTRTTTIDLRDGSLSVETGGRSATTGEWSYTFLEYIDIVPVE